ncbi:MAG: methionine adenosyltransferase [Bacteroidota bacterium]|nr:methionine adenosyltransferase [Bacteroidota bacterium]
MTYLFTSESVSEGHPDKVADQISDALLDEFLRQDPDSKVACETLVTTGLAVLSGEVKSEAWVDVQQVAREVINDIGYSKPAYRFDGNSCGVISTIHEQSSDINQGVERNTPEEQGAGDQGMMFGYATDESRTYLPVTLSLSHLILQELSAVRREGKEMTYLRPDSKSQVTVKYDESGKPVAIDTIVVSTQHDDFIKPSDNKTQLEADNEMLEKIKGDVLNILIPRVKKAVENKTLKLFTDDFKLLINPTGKFVIGGPHGDTGLTGRKIIVDTYGGRGAHGGGAFSGKDSSKVDRSAAYATRYIAKNFVAAGGAKEVLLQVAYAIGVAEPVGFYVNTYGTAKVKDKFGKILSDAAIAEILKDLIDMRPSAIVSKFNLTKPIFRDTAAYGHFGREPYTKTLTLKHNGQETKEVVEYFAWEKTDSINRVKSLFEIE